jgi:hypothetical protein
MDDENLGSEKKLEMVARKERVRPGMMPGMISFHMKSLSLSAGA